MCLLRQKESITVTETQFLRKNWQKQLLQSCAEDCKLINCADHWIFPYLLINCSVEGDKIRLFVCQKA